MAPRLDTNSLPFSILPRRPADTDGAEPPSVLANDLRLTCSPRKLSPGRLAHLLQLAHRAVRADKAGIGLLTGEGALVEHLTVGMDRDEAARLEHSDSFQALLSATMRQPAPTRGAQLAQDVGSNGHAAVAGPFLGVPINCAGRSRGVLYLLRNAGEAEFTKEDEDLLGPVGSWLEQANLSEEARLLNRLRLLNQIAHAAAGNLDMQSILAVSVRELDRLLPLHVNAVWLVEDSHDHRCVGEPTREADESGTSAAPTSLSVGACSVSGQSTKMGIAPGFRISAEQVEFGRCLLDGSAFYADIEALLQEETSQAAARVRTLAEGGAITCFAVPMRAGERVVGVLQSICTRPAGFSGEHLQLLYLVGDLLGPAMSNSQLFHRLSEAYEELRKAQSQLIQAEKMRALGELAGGVAHEFNNALCGVLGFLELALLKKGLDPTHQGFLESARTCAMDAAQTVRRVQDFARWRRNELTSEWIDMGDFVRETVDLIRHKWESVSEERTGQIRVIVDTESGVRVVGNAAELREVLTNLAFNAVEAMPHGGTLTIRTWGTAANAFLTVSDTGLGIAEGVRRRLFEPFFTTKGERGNGLGLSVAFGIVRRHNGEISVESQVGQGSLFTVRLPLGTTPAAKAAPVSAPLPAAQPQRSLRILVVEDEESVRRFLDNGLSRFGHRTRLAGTVEEGTRALTEDQFDVVLTDLGLPDASGEELARRAAVYAPDTPVILLTGWAEQLLAENRTIQGITRILSKPVALETLSTALAEVTR